jgi:uncharacterized membrane protein
MKRIFSIAIAAGSLFLSAASSALAADRIIVATFGDTNNAYEAARAIKDLKEAGGTEFKLKTGVMIAKDQNGNVSVLESRGHPLFGTAAGIATGALIGMIAGAPGAAMGAALGATSGLGTDTVNSMLRADFVNSVRLSMHPGTTAIIAEADEGSTRGVDDIVARHGGQVHRQG